MTRFAFPLCFTIATSLASAQTSQLYITTKNTTDAFVVQGGRIIARYSRAANDDGPAFVVRDSVKMFGRDPGDVGREYDYVGDLLAGQYSNAAFIDCIDGASDGTRNWTVEAHGPSTGAVIVGDADWNNMQFAFQATPFSHGIAYDPTDDTLWTMLVYSYGEGDVEHYTTSGALLGSFHVVGPGGGSGLALDLADQTLWVCDNINEDLWQFDKNGHALQALYVPDLHGNFGGMEFGPPFGCVKYCWANSNSTGSPADITAVGTSSASAGSLFLTASLVPNQTGIFFHALNQTQVPFGNGYFCANGDIVRGALVSPSNNVARYVYDNSDVKHSLGGFVGTTRNFQYWFRDPMGGGAFFNTSNAVSVAILP